MPKKNGSIRFCVDYCKANTVTRKDAHPLPLIQDIFDSLTGTKVFSTLELKSGYWQIQVDEEDIKTAFVTHMGLYEFVHIPFGLANVPAKLQQTMQAVLGEMICQLVMVYLDDIMVYSQTEQERKQHLRRVFYATEAIAAENLEGEHSNNIPWEFYKLEGQPGQGADRNAWVPVGIREGPGVRAERWSLYGPSPRKCYPQATDTKSPLEGRGGPAFYLKNGKPITRAYLASCLKVTNLICMLCIEIDDIDGCQTTGPQIDVVVVVLLLMGVRIWS